MSRLFAGLLALSMGAGPVHAEDIHCFFSHGDDDEPWKVTYTVMGELEGDLSYVQMNLVAETDQSRVVFGNWAGVAAPEDGLRVAQINGSLYYYQERDSHMVEVLATPVVPEGAPTDKAQRMWGKLILDGKTVMSAPMEPVTYGGIEVISMRVGFHTLDGFENYFSDPVSKETFEKLEDTRISGRLAIYETNTEGEPMAPTEDQDLVASFLFDGQEIMRLVDFANTNLQVSLKSFILGCPDNRVEQ